jgi:8-oxo-dGTP pyrophosphatase MutT (NUDIX family)
MVLFDFEQLKIQWKEELSRPLPGLKAQLRMAPKGRLASRYLRPVRNDVRHSSVLILLYPDEIGRIRFPLILRTVYDGAHSGQVAFPGGKHEESDPDHHFTALREAEEELGIDPKRVDILGSLTELYVWASNYMVYPVVAIAPERPQFVPNAQEVAGYLEADLATLMSTEALPTTELQLREGLRIRAPYFPVEGKVVWGATAMILGEMLQIAARFLPIDGSFRLQRYV